MWGLSQLVFFVMKLETPGEVRNALGVCLPPSLSLSLPLANPASVWTPGLGWEIPVTGSVRLGIPWGLPVGPEFPSVAPLEGRVPTMGLVTFSGTNLTSLIGFSVLVSVAVLARAPKFRGLSRIIALLIRSLL